MTYHSTITDFRDVQLRLQQKQMAGEEITQEEVTQAQKTVALVQQHEKISQLMEAEQRMSMLIGDFLCNLFSCHLFLLESKLYITEVFEHALR